MQKFNLVEALTDLLGSSAQMDVYEYENIISLPALDYWVKDLRIRCCPCLSALPALPAGLETMDIVNCPNLSALPALPVGLRELHTENCPQLSALPALPEGVERMYIDNCPQFGGNMIDTRQKYQKARLRILVKQAVLEWWCKPDNMQRLVAKYGDPAKAYAAIGLGY